MNTMPEMNKSVATTSEPPSNVSNVVANRISSLSINSNNAGVANLLPTNQQNASMAATTTEPHEGKRLIRTIRPIDVRKLQESGLDRKIAEALSKQKQTKLNKSAAMGTKVASKPIRTLPVHPSGRNFRPASSSTTTTSGTATSTTSSLVTATHVLNPTLAKSFKQYAPPPPPTSVHQAEDSVSILPISTPATVSKSLIVKPIIPPTITITGPESTAECDRDHLNALSPEQRMKHVKSLLHKKLLERKKQEGFSKLYINLKPPADEVDQIQYKKNIKKISKIVDMPMKSHYQASPSSEFTVMVKKEPIKSHHSSAPLSKESTVMVQKHPMKSVQTPLAQSAVVTTMMQTLPMKPIITHIKQEQQHFYGDSSQDQWGPYDNYALKSIGHSNAYEHLPQAPIANYRIAKQQQPMHVGQQIFIKNEMSRVTNDPGTHAPPRIQKQTLQASTSNITNTSYAETENCQVSTLNIQRTPATGQNNDNKPKSRSAFSTVRIVKETSNKIAKADTHVEENRAVSQNSLISFRTVKETGESTPRNKVMTKPKTPQKSPQDIARKLDFQSDESTSSIQQNTPTKLSKPSAINTHDVIYNKSPSSRLEIPKASIKTNSISTSQSNIALKKQFPLANVAKDSSKTKTNDTTNDNTSSPVQSSGAKQQKMVTSDGAILKPSTSSSNNAQRNSLPKMLAKALNTPPSSIKINSPKQRLMPDVSPLKVPFPTVNIPQETPLPTIDTFKKPNPLPGSNYYYQMPATTITTQPEYIANYQTQPNIVTATYSMPSQPQSAYNVASHTNANTLMTRNSLIVLENKVLSQDEMIDLTALRFPVPQRFAKPHKPIPEVVIKQEKPDDIAHFITVPKVSQQSNPNAAQQSMILVSSKQNKKYIVNASKLKLPPEQLANLAKKIAERASNHAASKQSMAEVAKTTITTTSTMQTLNSAQVIKTNNQQIYVAPKPFDIAPQTDLKQSSGQISMPQQIPNLINIQKSNIPMGQKQYFLLVKKDAVKPKLANAIEQSLTVTACQPPPKTFEEPNQPNPLQLQTAANIFASSPVIPFKCSPIKNRKSAVEIIDESDDDDEEEATFSAVDFIASLASSNPITEETQLELSPEELNLNASCAMNLSPLRIPFPARKRTTSTTRQFTTPESKSHSSKRDAIDIGNIVDMQDEMNVINIQPQNVATKMFSTDTLIDTIVIDSSKGRDVLRKSVDHKLSGKSKMKPIDDKNIKDNWLVKNDPVAEESLENANVSVNAVNFESFLLVSEPNIALPTQTKDKVNSNMNVIKSNSSDNLEKVNTNLPNKPAENMLHEAESLQASENLTSSIENQSLPSITTILPHRPEKALAIENDNSVLSEQTRIHAVESSFVTSEPRIIEEVKEISSSTLCDKAAAQTVACDIVTSEEIPSTSSLSATSSVSKDQLFSSSLHAVERDIVASKAQQIAEQNELPLSNTLSAKSSTVLSEKTLGQEVEHVTVSSNALSIEHVKEMPLQSTESAVQSEPISTSLLPAVQQDVITSKPQLVEQSVAAKNTHATNVSTTVALKSILKATSSPKYIENHEIAHPLPVNTTAVSKANNDLETKSKIEDEASKKEEQYSANAPAGSKRISRFKKGKINLVQRNKTAGTTTKPTTSTKVETSEILQHASTNNDLEKPPTAENSSILAKDATNIADPGVNPKSSGIEETTEVQTSSLSKTNVDILEMPGSSSKQHRDQKQISTETIQTSVVNSLPEVTPTMVSSVESAADYDQVISNVQVALTNEKPAKEDALCMKDNSIDFSKQSKEMTESEKPLNADVGITFEKGIEDRTVNSIEQPKDLSESEKPMHSKQISSEAIQTKETNLESSNDKHSITNASVAISVEKESNENHAITNVSVAIADEKQSNDKHSITNVSVAIADEKESNENTLQPFIDSGTDLNPMKANEVSEIADFPTLASHSNADLVKSDIHEKTAAISQKDKEQLKNMIVCDVEKETTALTLENMSKVIVSLVDIAQSGSCELLPVMSKGIIEEGPKNIITTDVSVQKQSQTLESMPKATVSLVDKVKSGSCEGQNVEANEILEKATEESLESSPLNLPSKIVEKKSNKETRKEKLTEECLGSSQLNVLPSKIDKQKSKKQTLKVAEPPDIPKATVSLVDIVKSGSHELPNTPPQIPFKRNPEDVCKKLDEIKGIRNLLAKISKPKTEDVGKNTNNEAVVESCDLKLNEEISTEEILKSSAKNSESKEESKSNSRPTKKSSKKRKKLGRSTEDLASKCETNESKHTKEKCNEKSTEKPSISENLQENFTPTPIKTRRLTRLSLNNPTNSCSNNISGSSNTQANVKPSDKEDSTQSLFDKVKNKSLENIASSRDLAKKRTRSTSKSCLNKTLKHDAEPVSTSDVENLAASKGNILTMRLNDLDDSCQDNQIIIPNINQRKKFRKTLEDIKKSHKPLVTDSEDDRDFESIGGCDGPRDFLGFEDNSLGSAKSQKPVESNSDDEKPLAAVVLTTKGGTLKNWLTTGKAISPTFAKDDSNKRLRHDKTSLIRGVPLKKRWDSLTKSQEETDITDDNSPAYDEDEESADLRKVEKYNTVIDNSKDLNKAKRLKIDETKEFKNDEAIATTSFGLRLIQHERKVSETDSDTPLLGGKRLKRARRRLISDDFDEKETQTKAATLEDNSKIVQVADTQEDKASDSGSKLTIDVSEKKRQTRRRLISFGDEDTPNKIAALEDNSSIVKASETQVYKADDSGSKLTSDTTKKRRQSKCSKAKVEESIKCKTLNENRSSATKSLEDNSKIVQAPETQDDNAGNSGSKLTSDTSKKRRQSKGSKAKEEESIECKALIENSSSTTKSLPNHLNNKKSNKTLLIESATNETNDNIELTPKIKSKRTLNVSFKSKVEQEEAVKEQTTNIATKNSSRKSKPQSADSVVKEENATILDNFQPQTPLLEKLKTIDTPPSTDKRKRRNETPANIFNTRLLLITKREQMETDEILTEAEVGSGPIQCGLCLKRVVNAKWVAHLAEHYGVGWKNGEASLEITYRPAVINAISVFFKDNPDIAVLKCRMCPKVYRSALGLISHVESCGVTIARVECEYCHRSLTQSSIASHIRICTVRLKKEKQEQDKQEKLEKHKIECTEEVFSSTGRAKRKSTLKAESKLKEIEAELVKANFNPKDYIRHRPPMSLGKVVREKWTNALATAGKGVCPAKICSYISDKIEDLENHFQKCKIVQKSRYLCTYCKMRCYDSEQEAIDHINAKHYDAKDFSDSDCNVKTDDETSSNDDDLSEGVDEDDSDSNELKKETSKWSSCKLVPRVKANVSMSVIIRKKVLARRVREGLNQIVLEKWKRFLKCNYFSAPSLCNFKSQYTILNSEDYTNYLPCQESSMKFSLSNDKTLSSNIGEVSENIEWQQIQRFETIPCGTGTFAFLGAPVTYCSWLPLPQHVEEQYLLAAYRKDMFKYTKFLNPASTKTTLLLFKVTKAYGSKVPQINVQYGIALEGPIHHFSFLPSGGYSLDANRLGLVAVATVKSLIKIYALPIELPNVEKQTNENVPLLSIVPSFVLNFDATICDAMDHTLTKTQCLQICWSEFSGHKHIFASFSNGFIGIWDITNDSQQNLNRFEVEGVINYAPINYFYLGEKCIKSIAIHYDTHGPRWLAGSTFYRKLLIYDIQNFMNPLLLRDETAKNTVSFLDWCPLWEAVLTAYTDTVPNNGRCVQCISPINVVHTHVKLDQMLCAVTGVHYTPLSNMCVASMDNGDILFTDPKELNYECALGKAFGERRILSTMDIKRLDNQPLERLQVPKDDMTETVKLENEWILHDRDYKEKYGLVFQPLIKLKASLKTRYFSATRRPALNILPYMRINSLRCNLNRRAKGLVAVGYENGFMRIMHFDKDSHFSKS